MIDPAGQHLPLGVVGQHDDYHRGQPESNPVSLVPPGVAVDDNDLGIQVAVIQEQVGIVRSAVHELRQELRDFRKDLHQEYTPHREFLPVRNLVYSFIGLIVTGVVASVLALVIR